MNSSDQELLELYRAAQAEESSTAADRRAVQAGLVGLGVTAWSAAGTAAGVAATETAATGATATGATATGATATGAAAAGTAGAGASGLSGATAGVISASAPMLSIGKIAGWVACGAALGLAATSVTVSGIRWASEGPTPSADFRSAPPPDPRPALGRPSPKRGLEAISGLPSAVIPTTPGLVPERLSTAPVQALPSGGVRNTPRDGEGAAPAIEGPSSAALVDSSASDRQSSTLATESRGLSEIQAALTQGQPDRALVLLRQQEAQFPDGVLAEERAAARVIALCAAHRREEAAPLRVAFLAAFPNSLWRVRVLRSCEH